jgi:hypothetical protein
MGDRLGQRHPSPSPARTAQRHERHEGRDDKDRIIYDSLWVHAKRHYDLAATTAYWRARMHKELMNALGG